MTILRPKTGRQPIPDGVPRLEQSLRQSYEGRRGPPRATPYGPHAAEGGQELGPYTRAPSLQSDASTSRSSSVDPLTAPPYSSTHSNGLYNVPRPHQRPAPVVVSHWFPSRTLHASEGPHACS